MLNNWQSRKSAIEDVGEKYKKSGIPNEHETTAQLFISLFVDKG